MNSLRSTIVLMAVTCAAIVTSAAHAADVSHGSILRFVYPQGDGSFVLGFMTESASCTSGGTPKYYRVAAGQNGVTADGVKAMLATSLAAYALGKTVWVAFDDATSNCYINRLSVQD